MNEMQPEIQSEKGIKRNIFERIWWIVFISYPPLFLFGTFSLSTAHGRQLIPYACISTSLSLSLLLSLYSILFSKKIGGKMTFAGIAQGFFFSWPIFCLYLFGWIEKLLKIS